MKSLPTEYRGLTFRSRMEARWAVFFDHLQIPYDYEPEGYDLDGDFYLPDFWLPEHQIFVEVKPAHPTRTEQARAMGLASHTHHSVLFHIGNPRVPDFGQHQESGVIFMGDGGCDLPYWWCECPICHRLDVQFSGYADRIPCKCRGRGHKCYAFSTPRLQMAYEVARTHSFWQPAHA